MLTTVCVQRKEGELSARTTSTHWPNQSWKNCSEITRVRTIHHYVRSAARPDYVFSSALVLSALGAIPLIVNKSVIDKIAKQGVTLPKSIGVLTYDKAPLIDWLSTETAGSIGKPAGEVRNHAHSRSQCES